MARRSGSTLFLMEQLIVVAVFAICAAACVRIMTASYYLATDTRDISNAIEVAENCAERYKAVSGDIAKTAELLGGNSFHIDGASIAFVYYDKDWRICNQADAFYKLSLTSGASPAGSPTLLQSELMVERLTGEVIISFPVAVNKEG